MHKQFHFVMQDPCISYADVARIASQHGKAFASTSDMQSLIHMQTGNRAATKQTLTLCETEERGVRGVSCWQASRGGGGQGAKCVHLVHQQDVRRASQSQHTGSRRRAEQLLTGLHVQTQSSDRQSIGQIFDWILRHLIPVRLFEEDTNVTKAVIRELE